MNRFCFPLAIAAAVLVGSGPSSAQVARRGLPSTNPSVHATPRAGEHRLTGQEIKELAQRQVLWCDSYKATSDDCDAVTLVTLSPDGRLAETTTMLISDGPRLQAYIGEVDDIAGDQVCSKVAAAKMPFAFTLEGKTVPQDAALGLRAILASSLSDLDGKTVCQSFYRGSDPKRLREEVTVDGQRRPDLETTYVLHEAGVGFGLRPQVARDDEKGQKA